MSPEIMRRPISPEEALEVKVELVIPEEVYIAVNGLIAQNLHRDRATVLQKDIVEKLVQSGMNKNEIFARKWLDVEDSYREAGWDVMYDKPGYCETYDAYFEFKKPRDGGRRSS